MRETPSGRRDSKSRPRGIQADERMAAGWLRIIAGEFRSRRIYYNGDHHIRPMKDRTRESVFSLLGGHLTGFYAVDLFGGTGVMAFESISRGASGAIILELGRSAMSMILHNISALQLGEKIQVHNVDTLRWMKHLTSTCPTWPKQAWVVFCCPPYKMWRSDEQRLVAGLQELYALSPEGSQFVLESDESFDVQKALPTLSWDVRSYKPARIAICRK